MATKEELKQVFVTGAIPTEKDFHDLIDASVQDLGEFVTQEELSSELSKKANSSSLNSKADKTALDDLVSRVEALEDQLNAED